MPAVTGAPDTCVPDTETQPASSRASRRLKAWRIVISLTRGRTPWINHAGCVPGSIGVDAGLADDRAPLVDLGGEPVAQARGRLLCLRHDLRAELGEFVR